MNALDYFLKANLYGLLLVGCYWLFLRRHTFFSLNRAYLLLSAVLSLVLPLASLPTQTAETLPVPVGVIVLPVVAYATAPVETGPNWEQIGLVAYGLISLIFLLRVAVRTGRLVWLIHRSPRQISDHYVMVHPNDPTTPTFSFFSYMVLNPADVRNDLIIEHEWVHIRQHHSIDVLGMAVLRAIFWACPALWLIDQMLRQVHEFLADKPTNQSNDYARFLVEYTFRIQPDTLTNGFFNPSLLKQRIVMLHQKATTRWALGKYVLVIPLALGLLAMTTAREEIVTMVTQATDETITVSGRMTSAVDGKPLPGAFGLDKNTTIETTNSHEDNAAIVSQAANETITVSGRVTSVLDGKPLPGATVNSPLQFTTTNSDGRYVLKNVPKDASLRFSFVGFESQVVAIKGNSSVDVVMPVKTNTLNEVYVVGFETPSTSISSTGMTTHSNSLTGSSGDVQVSVEQQPEFPGGMNALGQYLAKSIRYPTEAHQNKVQGKVFLQFIVSQTGEIRDLRILKGIGFGCDEEAVRVVSQMPKWRPGRQQGEAVAVQYNLPIQFALEKREDKRTGQVIPTTPPDSGQKTGVILDDSKNSRFALYNDATTGPKERYSLPLPDSLQKSGIPIQIRGNALSGGEPLYLLNGVELSKDNFRRLDPHTIESLTVLKNSAAAVYGPKALFGVVLITTKKK